MKNPHKSHFFQISEKFYRIFSAKFVSNDLSYPILSPWNEVQSYLKFYEISEVCFYDFDVFKNSLLFLPASAKESKHIWLFRKTRRIFCTSLLRWPWMALAVIAKKHEKSPYKSFFLEFQKNFFSFFWRNMYLTTSITILNHLKTKLKAFEKSTKI